MQIARKQMFAQNLAWTICLKEDVPLVMDWWTFGLGSRLPQQQEWYEKVFGAAANSIPGTWCFFGPSFGPSKVRFFGSWLHKVFKG